MDKVISASESSVKDAVLKFKDTNDGGRGRFGSMTDNTQVSIYTYQVSRVTCIFGSRRIYNIYFFVFYAQTSRKTSLYDESVMKETTNKLLL